jgi:hypothetical protein
MNEELNLAVVPPTHVADLPALMQLATQLVPTGFLPDHIKTPGQAVAIILSGRELGIGPMLALRSIYMIKGKIELSADLQLSLFKRDGGQAEFTELNESKATLKLKHPNGDPHIESFSMEDAKRAMLGGDNWKKYPKAMLRSRVITAGLKSIGFEPKMSGCYAPGEIGGPETILDIEPEPTQPEPEPEQPKAPAKANSNGGKNHAESIAAFTKWLYEHVGADIAGWAIPYLRSHTPDGGEASSALMPNEDLTGLSEASLGAIRKDIAGFLERLKAFAEQNSQQIPGAEVGEKTVTSILSKVHTKIGDTNGKKWTLYSITIGVGNEFVTFSKSVGQAAKEAEGQTVTLFYLTDDKGNTATAIKVGDKLTRAGESKEK